MLTTTEQTRRPPLFTSRDLLNGRLAAEEERETAAKLAVAAARARYYSLRESAT